MTEAQARQKAVGVMQSWIGIREGSDGHKTILKTYNEFKDKTSSYEVKETDAWCATTVSAAMIAAGFADIFPLECSCGRMIPLSKKKGCWQENDAYFPSIGDDVVYDWDDKANYATTDNKGWPEHIGMIEKIVGNTMTVMEGNLGNMVKRRNLQINGRYIRGFITPDYASKADKEEVKVTKNLQIGDVVNFIGDVHYTNSYAKATPKKCKGGTAKVTAIKKGNPHPYHLVAIGKNCTVYGWVDSDLIRN